ncbi:hypothetical protein Nepgr_022117 [Nepenthes gracilis]|uniref:Uncharacterized protein n=1 Tax=Nepenthes gracilis TaxID=150966 RepID=A0AAD3T081_NEPGR|nr:hypothetical protein Nepgr_022117 [Nepenthes gracilis]
MNSPFYPSSFAVKFFNPFMPSSLCGNLHIKGVQGYMITICCGLNPKSTQVSGPGFLMDAVRGAFPDRIWKDITFIFW